MNVNDFEAPPLPESWPEILELIFTRQRELMEKYKEIEKLPQWPISLHTSSGQKVLRDFAWRSHEELCESFEAHQMGDMQHKHEELADALHFLVEAFIFAGITSQQCIEMVEEFPVLTHNHVEPTQAYWYATYSLGLSMNFLRNKGWKQSQVPTDEGRFRTAMLVSFKYHCMLWASSGLGASAMFGYYFKKSEVNKFRQRSNY